MRLPTRTADAGPSASGTGNVVEALLAVGREADTALLCGDLTLTYGQLRRRVGSLAGRLRGHGLEPGDRVGLVAENGPFFATAYLATLHAGLCSVPLPTSAQAASLAGIAAATDMQLLLASHRYGSDDDVIAGCAAGPVEIWDEARIEEGRVAANDAGAAAAPAKVQPATDLAALFFTSGSTGEPKGVMVSHGNIAANTRDIVEYMALRSDDRVMLVLPLHYCYGLSVLHTHLAAGAAVVINNAFMFPEKVLDEIEARGCTGFAGVPSNYQILLRKTRLKQRRLPSLRWLQQAGGKLPDTFLRELREALPEARLYVMYGQTEATARLSYLPPERLDDKLGSIGRGLPSTILEVLGADGLPVAPGSDEVGEIVATGENVTLGYWRDAETTARYFRRGRLHTRDMARVDADGFIYIVDRARDFIKSMGNRISPKEIEDVIAELEAVIEVAVVGVPDDLWGEAVWAYVVAAAPPEPQEIIAHCNARLPNFKVPARVEIIDALPKNDAGKVLKHRLRDSARHDSTAADGPIAGTGEDSP